MALNTIAHFIFSFQYLVSSIEIEAIIHKRSKLKYKWIILWACLIGITIVFLSIAISMQVKINRDPEIYLYEISFFYALVTAQVICTTMVLIAVFKINRISKIIPSHLTKNTQLIICH